MQKQTMILSILLLVTALTFAQEPERSISGLIVDQNNNPVPAVTVRAVPKEQRATVHVDKLLTTQTNIQI